METSTIFIDTSIFISKNYYFEGSEFQSLIRLVKEDKINIVTTGITLKEIRTHITEDTEKAIQEVQRIRKKGKILRNFPDMPLNAIFEEIHTTKYTNHLHNSFDSFIRTSRTKILQNDNAAIDQVFKLYFEKRAPFGEGKKKNEFPDAFVLEALYQYAIKSGGKIYVISGDKDFAEGVNEFENLFYLPSLSEFLNIAISHYEHLAPQVLQFLSKNITQVTKDIKKDFLCLGFYLSDQEGDVDDINILEIFDIEPYLIDINDGYAIFGISCVISFSANIIYDDLETASYDSEDKILIPWRKIDTIIEREERIEAESTITFYHQEPHSFVIQEVQMTSPKNDVEVYANEYNY